MTDDELPEFIDEDILRVRDVEVPDHALLRCFQQANKPWLSVSAVSETCGLGTGGTRNRLNSLVDRGVLLKDTVTADDACIYWINDPRSRWPVPADLHLPEPDESEQPSASWGEKELVAGATVFVAAMAAAALVAAAGDYNLLRPGFISAIQAWIGFAYIGSLAAIVHGTWTTVKERGGWRRHFQKFRR
jgi:hypothetical protein